MVVSDVRVFGRSKAKDVSHQIIENLVDYLLDRKIEIVCQDQIVDEIVSMVDRTCHTCLRSDGNIYVYNGEMPVLVETGERRESEVSE